MATARDNEIEVKAKALAVIFAPVDAARAVFRGLVVVGHRRSIEVGEMFWALPGGQFAHAPRLRVIDPTFSVIDEPSMHYLHEQQPVLRGLMA